VKKIMNRVDDFLSESLAGFAIAHDDVVTLNSEPVFVRRKRLTQGKVALISGGGSGHEPLHAGFVGYGMLDAACPGHVFTSPTPDQMLAAAHAADTGAGVLMLDHVVKSEESRGRYAIGGQHKLAGLTGWDLETIRARAGLGVRVAE